MFISDTAIHRPVITVVSIVALVVFGVLALTRLDTDEFPEVQPPVVAVGIAYPGAAPETVEREVVEPVEEVVAGISGTDRVTSTSYDGFASLVVEFVFEKDLQAATQDVRDAISGIRNELPAEMEEPVLSQFDPNDLPIVSLTLSSDTLSAAALTRLADPGLTRPLRAVPGVAEVNVVGGVERELTVEIRPDEMEAAGVGIGQVVQALQAENLAAPVGRISRDLDERAIRLQGRLPSPTAFGDLVVARSGPRLVHLREIATVRDGTEEARTAALFNGAGAVGIDIVKSTAASTTAVAEAIRVEVARLQSRLQADATLRIVRDAGERVHRSVESVQQALVEGALLTVVVVFVFLNSWRSTVITGLALPVSALAAFVPVWAFGFTLNTMSLLGLSLAIGILIDDAIVVRENIVRHVEQGKSHFRAALEGTDEIGLAVTATTLSIVVVFVPIAFMGGLAQQWFAPFALTIAASVLVSLFVSFSLDPMLSAYWADPPTPMAERSWISRRLGRFNEWFDRQARRYQRVIAWALDHRWTVMGLAVLSLALALALPAVGAVGTAFFPETDESEFAVTIETPPGANLDYTRLKAAEVSSLARGLPETRYTYTTIGGQTGAVDQGQVFVKLSPKHERARSQQEVTAGLRERFARLTGVTAAIASGGFGAQKQIQIRVQGPDAGRLNTLADRVRTLVEAVPGAVDVGLSTRGQKPELHVTLDRGLAAALGVTAADVTRTLRPAFAGIDVGDWVDPAGETRDVTVRLAPGARTSVDDLQSLPLMTAGDDAGPAPVPLGQVASVEERLGPARIEHLDRERVVTVQANAAGRPLSAVIADITARLEALEVPPGYAITQGGETEDQREVFGRILVALAVAVMLMYFVLVAQFNSFLDPLAILFSLPLSLIGVVLGLLVTGNTLNLMSLIGVILLMGIVAKNAILLIDFAKWAEEDGRDRRTALIEAGRVRLRPILMTSFALTAGMLPVALGRGEGADFRAPLGIAVIGGVVTSTVLTLLVIPTAYEILADLRDAVRRRLGMRAASHQEPAATGPSRS